MAKKEILLLAGSVALALVLGGWVVHASCAERMDICERHVMDNRKALCTMFLDGVAERFHAEHCYVGRHGVNEVNMFRIYHFLRMPSADESSAEWQRLREYVESGALKEEFCRLWQDSMEPAPYIRVHNHGPVAGVELIIGQCYSEPELEI